MIRSNPGYKVIDHDKRNQLFFIFNKGQLKESNNILYESFVAENIFLFQGFLNYHTHTSSGT